MLGVVAALECEARAFSGRRIALGGPVMLGERIALFACGIGEDRAGVAARALLAHGARALLSFGIAGGLDPALRPGDLVLARWVAATSGRRLPATPAWRERLAEQLADHAPVAGGIAHAATVLATAHDKRALGAASGAVAVDMESLAIATVAAEAGVAFAALRAIADPAGEDLPGAALGLADPFGRPRVAATAAALLRRPFDLGALLRLRGEVGAACGALRRATAGAGTLAGARAARQNAPPR